MEFKKPNTVTINPVPEQSNSGTHDNGNQLDTNTITPLSDQSNGGSDSRAKKPVPLSIKILAVAIVSMYTFGSRWSNGVTGALKSTLKKELHISNIQYAILTSTKDIIKLSLILFSGVLTDRYGGASTMLCGTAVDTFGAIMVASATQVRSFKFMIVGSVIESLGEVAVSTAQYKILSSWFAPSSGFASSVGIEHGIGKIGSFVAKSTANIIAHNLGLSWAYWMIVFMNLFTNTMAFLFWWMTRQCEKRYAHIKDPATGETLTENTKKFQIRKIMLLPWSFWNSTELAEQRFNISPSKAGIYSAVSHYSGFFLAPLIGIFIDVFGQRITLMLICGLGLLLSMCLLAWGPTVAGAAASLIIYGIASSYDSTLITDSLRTSMWYQDIFGSGVAIRSAVRDSMEVMVNLIAGVLQDRDDNKYYKVTILYVVLAAGCVLVACVMLGLGFATDNMGKLQWSRKKRVENGHVINARRQESESGSHAEKQRMLNIINFSVVLFLILGAWVSYLWGLVTKQN
ncbi:major facilitator superfamily transporter [Fusarium globosum]|uniref:Lysosomal dipeptide transporter MFSD1 n=1 Tax=Fusarium globosum TaxID=78864 RepID=A0A8H5YFG5_9HYPO|nr:major facilitator superfamily transporter [Fusarium globosum]